MQIVGHTYTRHRSPDYVTRVGRLPGCSPRAAGSAHAVPFVVVLLFFFFFFNDTATTEIYTLSLHDALPIWGRSGHGCSATGRWPTAESTVTRSEEHTSELQSPYVISYAVFFLKKKRSHFCATRGSKHLRRVKVRRRRLCLCLDRSLSTNDLFFKSGGAPEDPPSSPTALSHN